MSGPRCSSSMLLVLFVLANSIEARASFMTDQPDVRRATPFLLEYRAETVDAGTRADEWVLIPDLWTLSHSALPGGESGKPEVPVPADRKTEPYAALGNFGGMNVGDVRLPSSGGGAGSCLPPAVPSCSGGMISSYLVDEQDILIRVPYMSGIFRPPRECSLDCALAALV